MSREGHFTDEEKAMIREIVREVLRELTPQINDGIELKAWRAFGRLIMATGLVSALGTVILKEAVERVFTGK